MYEEDFGEEICSQCIGKHVFSNFIEDNGEIGRCTFDESHGTSNKVMSIQDLAKQVDSYLRENYQSGEEYPYWSKDSDKIYYGYHGRGIEEIIGEDLECEEGIVDRIIENFPSHRDERKGGGFYSDDFFESEQEVNKRDDAKYEDHWHSNRVYFRWDGFCEGVKFENRFFGVKEKLDELFGETDKYSHGKKRPIREIKSGARIYRARKLAGFLTPEEIKKNPMKELGAPPKEIVPAGRMNYQHIPVFYGAFSLEVALAEVQPAIGECVAVGQFKLNEDIKVFDFTVYDDIYDDLATHVKKHEDTRYEVVSYIERAISAPVLAESKSLDYIPTQIVTEYLKEKFKVDGVVYFSSLFQKEHGNETRNIILFDKNEIIVPPNQNSKFPISLIDEDVSCKKINNIEYSFENYDDDIPF